MSRLKLFAGWLGLVAAAVMVALLFVSVRATAHERERAMTLAEDTLTDLQVTREAFRSERLQLHDQVDSLLTEVETLRRQSSDLRGRVDDLLGQVSALQDQVVDLGGTPVEVTEKVVVVPEEKPPPPPPPPSQPPAEESAPGNSGVEAPGNSGPNRNNQGTEEPAETAPEPKPEPTHPGCVHGRGPKHCRED